MINPQLNEHGGLQHLLTVEGLPRDILVHILDTANSFVGVTEREVKKLPLLRGNSNLGLHDVIQAKVHKELGWEFIPTVKELY